MNSSRIENEIPIRFGGEKKKQLVSAKVEAAATSTVLTVDRPNLRY